ncbi:phosphodiester glycosidase family protein [Nonomuraea ferruginea]
MQTLRLLAAATLVLTAAAPAQADPAPPIEDAPTASSYPPLSTLVAAQATGDRLDTAKKTRPVAPGITLTSFDRLDPLGWLRADALTADLAGGASADYVYSGEVSKTEPLSGPAQRSRAVAAVNGDFFDINNSGAAQGIGVQTGELVQSPMALATTTRSRSAATASAGCSRCTSRAPPPPRAAHRSRSPSSTSASSQAASACSPRCGGSYTRARAVEGATAVTEVELKDGVVAAVRGQAGEGPIPAGTSILLGRDAGAAALAGLKAGDKVEVAYRPKASDGGDVKAAVGGNWVLVKDGKAQNSTDQSAHPRTAVGFSADGKKMYLLTVDGRQADSRGVTLNELAAMMVELGAADALNLDGGGSSTMLAREPGQAAPQVENSPSDGGERHVPNGLALYAPRGQRQAQGLLGRDRRRPRPGPRRGAHRRRAPRARLPRPHAAADRRRIRRDVRARVRGADLAEQARGPRHRQGRQVPRPGARHHDRHRRPRQGHRLPGADRAPAAPAARRHQ